MVKLFVIASLACIASVAAERFAPIRTTEAGQIRGRIVEFEKHQVHLYEGIRYGRAERFEVSQPEKPFDDVYNATRYRFACPQPAIPFSETLDDGKGGQVGVANEDCLFLNVYAPVTNRTGHLPVMFWIHGGAFVTGSIFNAMYDGRVLAAQGEVVVVTVQYRLGPFGFLYGGSDKYPGNLGLMDQVLALKWVHKNIRAFGGNPYSVTIFGESAGSMSSGNLILAPSAKHLFQRAILQSGSPNSYLGSESKEKSAPKTKSLAETLKCPTDSMEVMVACLKNRTVNELLDTTKMAIENGESHIPVWNTTFLPHNPWHALKEGHFNPVDVIQGVNRDEGSIFVVQLFPNLAPESTTVFTRKSTNTFVSFLMSIFYPGKPEISKEIGDFYADRFEKLDDPDKFKHAVADVFGDFHLTCPSMLFVELMAMKRPQGHYYAYHLDRQSPLPLLGCRKWMGVCHAQDIVYMFGIPQRLRGAVFDEDEYDLSVNMVKTWTSFAHNSRPGSVGKNVTWGVAVDTHGENHSVSLMNLNPLNYKMLPNFYQNVCNTFWRPKLEQ